MRHTTFETDACPIARSLDVIGEWWSLLMIRDAMLGVRRFSDFQRRLGMARNILSARLKHLVACGILETAPATDGSAYTEYVLTEKGSALLPAMVALRQWGERYMFQPGEPRTHLLDRECGQAPSPMHVQDREGRIRSIDDLTLTYDRPAQGNNP